MCTQRSNEFLGSEYVLYFFWATTSRSDLYRTYNNDCRGLRQKYTDEPIIIVRSHAVLTQYIHMIHPRQSQRRPAYRITRKIGTSRFNNRGRELTRVVTVAMSRRLPSSLVCTCLSRALTPIAKGNFTWSASSYGR